MGRGRRRRRGSKVWRLHSFGGQRGAALRVKVAFKDSRLLIWPLAFEGRGQGERSGPFSSQRRVATIRAGDRERRRRRRRRRRQRRKERKRRAKKRLRDRKCS